MDRYFEKVLLSIKSSKTIEQLESCERLLEFFKIKFENDTEIDDNDLFETYDFLKNQLRDKKIKYDSL